MDDRNRKTTAKRNKERRHKEKQIKENEEKSKRKILNDINHIKDFVKEIEAETKEQKEKRKQKEEKKKRRLEQMQEGIAFGNKRIGKYKYEQQAVDFKLPEDLSKNLAGTEVEEGSTIRNCYESIIRRGLVQPAAEGRGGKKIKAKLRYKFTDKNYD